MKPVNEFYCARIVKADFAKADEAMRMAVDEVFCAFKVGRLNQQKGHSFKTIKFGDEFFQIGRIGGVVMMTIYNPGLALLNVGRIGQ
jgi:hypothetical protein